MYDLPGVGAWQAAWWRGLARHFREAGLRRVPANLTRVREPGILWAHPRLLFAQTCGYPLTHAFAGRLLVVATPCYDAPGCGAAAYSSAIVVRADAPFRALPELLGAACAINAPDSHSGCNALRAAMAPHANGRAPFRSLIVTGAHLASLRAVAEARAEVCAVDGVTHALLARHSPALLDGTRVLGFTPSAPALPYVTRAGVGGATLDRLRRALFAALADPALGPVRAALLIAGAKVLPETAYDRITRMEQDARVHCARLA